MNTKNNRRRLASRMKIGDAFLELLRTKELQRITVSDICKAAGVNRSTFYANYADVYDLADRLREYLEEQVATLYQKEREGSFNSNDFLRLFRHIQKNRVLYEIYFKLGYDNQIGLVQYDFELAGAAFENRDVEYHIEFFKSGLNAILKRWLASGCEKTPEEMNEILESEYRGRMELLTKS